MSPVSSGVRSHARSCVASRGHMCVSRRNPPPRVSRADRHFAHFSVVFFFSSTPVHSRLRGSSSFPETGVANDFSGFHAGLFSFAYIVMFITQKFSFKCR